MERNCQVQTNTSSVSQIIKDTIQYSTVNNNLNNSTVQLPISEIFKNLTDLIPDDGYKPFYNRKYQQLGYERFMELAQKARAGSDTPQRLFCWMLKNHELVK